MNSHPSLIWSYREKEKERYRRRKGIEDDYRGREMFLRLRKIRYRESNCNYFFDIFIEFALIAKFINTSIGEMTPAMKLWRHVIRKFVLKFIKAGWIMYKGLIRISGICTCFVGEIIQMRVRQIYVNIRTLGKFLAQTSFLLYVYLNVDLESIWNWNELITTVFYTDQCDVTC